MGRIEVGVGVSDAINMLPECFVFTGPCWALTGRGDGDWVMHSTELACMIQPKWRSVNVTEGGERVRVM